MTAQRSRSPKWPRTAASLAPWSRRGILQLLAGGAAAGLLAGRTAEVVDAEGTKPGEQEGPGEGMTREGLEKLVQFNHPEKQFGFLPGMNEELLAGMYGVDLATYRDIKGRFDANAQRAALDLLDDPSFAERVDRLPFGSGATVVGLGDSFTDDLQSWLEIVRHLFEERRPQDGVRFANLGVSGSTTARALRYFVPIVSRQPDWIICFLGGNDATRIGPEPNKTFVSLDETARNIAAMRRIAATQTTARWVWITPPTLDEERADTFPPFKQGQSSWRNDDFVAVGDLIRDQPEPVVDIQAVFGRPAAPELQGPDGVHPSLAGQQAIAKALVERLTS